MKESAADVVVVGSGAGGGTVAEGLAPLVRQGLRILVLEQGPRLRAEDYTSSEVEMAEALYEDAGGFLNAEGTLTFALGRAYGGSTVVYTGTSLPAPERVVRRWDVPGLAHGDLVLRSRRHAEANHVHLLPPDELNDNNRLFVEGCRRLGLRAEQFPLNVRGCRGASLCNLGCPNGAKQGTHRVQLPRAEAAGVEVVTRAEVLGIEERAVHVRVSERPPGGKGTPPEWAPGEYRVRAGAVVLAGGAVGTPALMLRSRLPVRLPRLGEGFTCHPAHILVGEHPAPITNDVGHPKSFYLDRAEEEGYVLETCMYFPFTTAKNLTGFGSAHSALMQAFTRLQMILVLACDHVLVTDEQSASFMADGVWRASGRLACVNVVPGAGLTHALSGIAEAYMDNVAMLVLGCGVRRDTGKAFQLHDVDQLGIAAPVGPRPRGSRREAGSARRHHLPGQGRLPPRAIPSGCGPGSARRRRPSSGRSLPAAARPWPWDAALARWRRAPTA